MIIKEIIEECESMPPGFQQSLSCDEIIVCYDDDGHDIVYLTQNHESVSVTLEQAERLRDILNTILA